MALMSSIQASAPVLKIAFGPGVKHHLLAQVLVDQGEHHIAGDRSESPDPDPVPFTLALHKFAGKCLILAHIVKYPSRSVYAEFIGNHSYYKQKRPNGQQNTGWLIFGEAVGAFLRPVSATAASIGT